MKEAAVLISPAMDERISAFLRLLSDVCKDCFSRNTAKCDNCMCVKATIILMEYDADKRHMNARSRNEYLENDGTIDSRMDKICRFLFATNRPVKSVEIPQSQFGSCALKEYTLHRMIDLKMISRYKDGKSYRYMLTETTKERMKNESNNCNSVGA